MLHSNRGPMTEAMYYVLLALLKPLHGYGIMQRVKDISQNRVPMGPGTLYGIINRMLEDKYIVLEEKNSRRKTYRLTASGLDVLNDEYERLFTMVQNGNELLKEAYSSE